jgi:hypothetical protein
MSICLLCYAFPFYVSAITLARSELSLLICLVLMYLFLFFSFTHPPSPHLSLFALFRIFFSFIFRCLLCPYATGFSRPGSLSACNGSPNCSCASFSLILLGQAFCEKFIYATPCFLCVSFFSFFFLQAAKLNYVRFEDCFCFFISSFC